MTADGIAVVVVSFRSASTIDACLQQLRNAEAVVQVRVVDNGSDDDSMAIVQRHAVDDARVRFIANPDNPGFAVACNQGAADSDAPWLAFVNPDCMVEADSFRRLLAHAGTLAPPVMLGCEQLDASGRADPAVRRRDPDFAAMLRSRAARELALPRDPGARLQPVQALSGALLLLPRRLFQRIGGFDEGYRLHAEDLDLCRRARQSGASIAVANDVTVRHLRGISSRSRPLFVEWHKHRGFWRYFRKFDAEKHGIATRVAVFAMIWMRFVVAASAKILRRGMGADD
ncbi:MAG: glycosyltransferase family 2 protein [Pseudoxanthomonas suwonensis]|nr:glycosyltransferase family 2 protein [Pseudoxanthomonas suwonensis]